MIDSNDIVPSNELILETANDLESELAKFRNEWKSELSKQEAKQQQQQQIQTDKDESNHAYVSKTAVTASLRPVLDVNSDLQNVKLDLEKEDTNSNEEKAQYLFNKGVLLEQQGRHFEGIILTLIFYYYSIFNIFDKFNKSQKSH